MLIGFVKQIADANKQATKPKDTTKPPTPPQTPPPVPPKPPKRDEPKQCKPCQPIKGTIGYRLDDAGSSAYFNKSKDVRIASRYGISTPVVDGYQDAPHLNLYLQSQNPKTCQCWWHNLEIAVPPPAKTGWYKLGKSFSR